MVSASRLGPYLHSPPEPQLNWNILYPISEMSLEEKKAHLVWFVKYANSKIDDGRGEINLLKEQIKQGERDGNDVKDRRKALYRERFNVNQWKVARNAAQDDYDDAEDDELD